MTALTALFIALGLFTAYYLYALYAGVKVARAAGEPVTPTPAGLATGAVTDFFDTLGIGSFAPTTAIFRSARMVEDEQIPGTLNAGHTLPTILQAFIFTAAIQVDPKTLILMIAAAVAGARLGAGIFAGWPRYRVQAGVGIALLVAAALMAYKALQGDPAGGTAMGLSGSLLLIGLLGNFFLGVLMTIGIGLYGPCMLLVSMLGMNPTAAFPIMMGSCAFLMPVASARFIKERSVNMRAVVGLLIGGLPAVYLAAKVLTNVPIAWVRILVIVVVTYTGITLLMAARHRPAAEIAAEARTREAGG